MDKGETLREQPDERGVDVLELEAHLPRDFIPGLDGQLARQPPVSRSSEKAVAPHR